MSAINRHTGTVENYHNAAIQRQTDCFEWRKNSCQKVNHNNKKDCNNDDVRMLLGAV